MPIQIATMGIWANLIIWAFDPWMGKALLLDNIIQLAEKFKDLYTPAMAD